MILEVWRIRRIQCYFYKCNQPYRTDLLRQRERPLRIKQNLPNLTLNLSLTFTPTALDRIEKNISLFLLLSQCDLTLHQQFYPQLK